MGRRGILSSLGAGLSLVIAGVIALAVVSGVVAYRGWPGMRATPPADDVTMPAVAARTAAAETSRPVVLGSGAPAARRERAGARGPARRSDRRRRTARRDGRAPERPGASPRARDGDRTVAAGEPGGPASAGDGATPSTGGGGTGDGRGSAPAASTPDPLGRAVEGVERIVDDVTPPADEPGAPPVDVPGVVQDTTRTVEEVVEDTTATVDGVTDGATGTVNGLLP